MLIDPPLNYGGVSREVRGEFTSEFVEFEKCKRAQAMAPRFLNKLFLSGVSRLHWPVNYYAAPLRRSAAMDMAAPRASTPSLA